MKTIKDCFQLRGRSIKYQGREYVVESIAQGKQVNLMFGRDEHEQIVAINPITNELVGAVPPIVCDARPELEDKYDLLECFVDLGLATAVATKVKRDNIVIEVSVFV